MNSEGEKNKIAMEPRSADFPYLKGKPLNKFISLKMKSFAEPDIVAGLADFLRSDKM